ncbi:acyl-CoA dehydrogenase family protein [Mycobacterium seoulense]|uniref:acyl-CoA dehydrogenase family protein n=1 Tax=Mycobacterium seoulense TaxID=386911 RepID=UPI003CF02E0C
MNFEMDGDVLALADAIAEFFARRSDAEAITAASMTSRTADRQRWAALCEMGLPALRVPEPAGIGARLLEATVVAEKVGAVLVPEPAAATIVLASAWSADEQSTGFLDALCGGSRITALCGFDTVELSETGVVSGRACVPDDDETDAVALPARDCGAGESAIVVLDTAALPPPVRRSAADPTRPTATVDLEGARPVDILRIGDWTAHRRELALLTAAELVGGMQALLTKTIDHAKGRQQFGRPIGSFQTIKHRLADMYIATEQARAAVQLAAVACEDGADTASATVASAARWVPRAAIEVAETAIHLHGAMGYSWETGVHLHLRRALTTRHDFDRSKLLAIGALSPLVEAV